jgi:hypothetical protein
MSDTYQGADQNRGGRRRRGGRNRRDGFRSQGQGRSQSNSGNEHFQRREPQPTAFQKFLNVVTFGLLGKPKPKKRPQRPDARPANAERTPGAARPERADRGDRPARPPREPQPPGEVTTERLYVGNLSYDATESDLFELFNGVGQVRNAEVVVNNHTQRSKGFAFVTMATVDEARRAVAELHGKEFMNRPLQVNGAKPFSKERPERGDRRERDDAADSDEESQPQAASV